MTRKPKRGKKFQYNLSTVLKVRNIFEKIEKEKFAQAERELLEQQKKEEEMKDHQKNMQRTLSDKLKGKIETHRQYMITHCDLPEVDLLQSFTGIGIYSAIGLILNIVSIDRFPSAKHLASYFGVHPVYKTSGDGKGAFRMSKKGRSAPRQILYMVARSSIVHNPLIIEIYINHLKKGNCKSSALGVCMHKILRIVFGMLKNQKPFDPEIDLRNRNRMRNTGVVAQVSDTKRRFQENADDAPVSRRQNMKRRKREQSQSLHEA